MYLHPIANRKDLYPPRVIHLLQYGAGVAANIMSLHDMLYPRIPVRGYHDATLHNYPRASESGCATR